MKKRNLLALPLAFVLLLSAACAPAAASPLTPQGEAPKVEAAREAAADRAVSALGASLLKAARQEGENTLLSPLSILLALGMVANGAEGETLEAFQALLGPDLTLDAFNGNCASLMEDYAGLGGKTNVEIANSLWLATAFQAEDDFLSACISGYGAGVFSADFADPATVGKVNAWIAAHTGDMIQDMLPSDAVSEDTAALLVNALYLDTKWAAPFEGTDTREGLFDPGAGRAPVPVEFLSGPAEERRYISTEEETGVILPYDDGRLAFLAVLPREGDLAAYLDGWDGDTLGDLVSAAGDTKLFLMLPKFKVEVGTELTDLLKGLGLGVAFDPERAGFSNMGTMEGDLPLFISRVLHKAAIHVEEQGTKAAAATAVVMDAGGAPAPDYEELVFDRPFVYAVVDMERGVPLFLGALENPPAAE